MFRAPMFTMRFDMRAPHFGAPTTDLYRAALEMSAFAESRGALAAVVSEHHGMDDGYLSAPMLLAGAIAARTSTLPIMTAALVLPLYNPVRLAEDMVVLDVISGGRVSHVLAVGYVEHEFEQLGADFHNRGSLVDEALEVLLRARTGEPFEHDGRRIHVTPAPVTPGGPSVAWGGGSAPAARRAGRFGLDFFAQGGGAELQDVYRGAAVAAGHEPGTCFVPPSDTATTVFVAEDVELAWEEVGPHLLHDATAYAALNPGNTTTASLSAAKSIDELRAEDRSHRIVTVEQAVAMVASSQVLQLQPLVGGLPPEVAWRYLCTFTDEVVPRL
jgi:alkanesulfonate monooxygenase SsuD/methylene tetrahydromethanopterin reductase-like flavin-dependent oxidoreductase (luciferase family)